MGPMELATASFGQGFNVTMIQMAAGFSSLINGGYYYEPHMVSKITASDGSVVQNIEPRLLKQTVSESTSAKIRDYCVDVVPCVVKVSSGGSSIGVSIVQKEEDYQAALDDAFLYGDEVVVEEYIKGRELTCCVLDGKALPIVEIAPKEGFYDYKNKYQAGSTIEICPAPIGEESTRKIQKISERVFDALRLHKYARMDFMMDEAGNAYCLEANTLPGMTPTSLIPQEAAAVGISYDELCQKILDMAFED